MRTKVAAAIAGDKITPKMPNVEAEISDPIMGIIIS